MLGVMGVQCSDLTTLTSKCGNLLVGLSSYIMVHNLTQTTGENCWDTYTLSVNVPNWWNALWPQPDDMYTFMVVHSLMHMLACMHTCMCVCTHTHTHMRSCKHTCMDTYKHWHAHTHTHACTHTCINTYTITWTHACMHAPTHACTCTHTHTHM